MDSIIPVFNDADDESVDSIVPGYKICDEDNDGDTICSVETNPTEYPVDIDFDDAHNEWMANKQINADGKYVYICGKMTNSGNKCRKSCCDLIGLYSGCKIHFMWEETEQTNA